MNAYYAEMSEWFKEHDWKSCVGLKPTGGSNPLLCAKKRHPLRVSFFAQNELAETPNYRKFMRGEKRERSPSSPSFSFSTTLCCAATIYFSLRPSGAERACRNSELSEVHARRKACMLPLFFVFLLFDDALLRSNNMLFSASFGRRTSLQKLRIFYYCRENKPTTNVRFS